jgi:hypothetical protein
MVRAVKGAQDEMQQAATDERVVVLDCADYHTLDAEAFKSVRFFEG